MNDEWIVQVLGEERSNNFEVSVIRKDNEHGRKSFGWFDENKLLISDADDIDFDDCSLLTEEIWEAIIKVAEEIAMKLNRGDENFCLFPFIKFPVSPKYYHGL